MARPPQPPLYLFLIDVSSISDISGLLFMIGNTIKEALSNELIKDIQRIKVYYY